MSIEAQATRDVVEQIVREIARRQGIALPPLLSETSLTDDLSFDSLMMVELCMALEERLGLPGSALEVWLNEQEERDGPRFTMGALLAFCDAARHEE